VLKHQGRTDASPIAGEVVQADGAANLPQPGGDALRQRASIEAIEAILDDGAQRTRQRRKAEPAADHRGLAIRQEHLGKAGQALQLGELVHGAGSLRGRDRNAILGVEDRVFEESSERELAAPALADRERLLPAADGSGDGIGRVGAAHRDARAAADPVIVAGCLCGGRPAGFDRNDRRIRTGDRPEPVAADAVHVRVDHGDRGGRRNHRFDGVAALA
jgi:hypothetical protein